MAIRVILAEDNYLLREGVRRLIEAQPELELAAVCEDFDSLVRAIDNDNPDVVLTDIRMPPTGTDEGIRAAEHLRQTHPDAGVVVLSQYADPAYALSFLEHGSRGRGYLLKERVSDTDQLLAAIQEVARGGSVIDPKVIDALVAARSRALTAVRSDGARVRGAVGDGAGQEQRRHCRFPGALGARRGEAHQLPLLEARPVRGA